MRVTVAAGLLATSALTVVASVVAGVWVGAAALFAVLGGTAAARIVYNEVVQTRRDAARDRVEQARSFGTEMTRARRDQRVFSAAMTARLASRDRTISELHGTIRLAERRADEAETSSAREARRADDVQTRLTALLDEVLAQPPVLAMEAEATELPAIVDLLAWEERVTLAAAETQQRTAESRRQA